jgi:hypothetical protein
MVLARSSAAIEGEMHQGGLKTHLQRQSPDDLFRDLWTCLADHHAILARIARRKGHSGPSIADCQRIARRQIEMLKHHGIVTVVRQVSRDTTHDPDRLDLRE